MSSLFPPYLQGAVLVSNKGRLESSTRLALLFSELAHLLCLAIPLSLYIVRRLHYSHLTRLILLGNQILHFWLLGFAQSLGYRSVVRVVRRSSSTSASFLLWLLNLPSRVLLLVKNQLGRWDSLLLKLLLDLALSAMPHTLPHHLLLGTAIWLHTSTFLLLKV